MLAEHQKVGRRKGGQLPRIYLGCPHSTKVTPINFEGYIAEVLHRVASRETQQISFSVSINNMISSAANVIRNPREMKMILDNAKVKR